MSSTALENYLQNTLISGLIKHKEKSGGTPKIIYVTTQTAVKEAITLLSNNWILAVPVREADEVRFSGWFSVMDALNFILKTYSEGESVDSQSPWSTWCRDIDTLTHRGQKLGESKVEEAMDKVFFSPVNGTGSVYELIEFFASQKAHHRVAVCNDEYDNFVRGIVTQSDVVDHLYRYSLTNPDVLGDFGKLPIGSIEGFRRNAEKESLVSMSINAQAIHAFWLMRFERVHGVPIIDNNGKLVANISASDIKGIGSGKLPFSSLLLPLRDFLRAAKFMPPLKVTWDTSLSSVIQQIALYRVHRVWIVDSQDIPVGVVTLSTLMSFLRDIGQDDKFSIS